MTDACTFETQPHATLRDVVRCVWVYACDDAETAPQRIAPGGCPELVLHFGAPLVRMEGRAETLRPRVLFAGQLTRPLVLRATGPFAMLGVRFEPDGARGFIGRAMCTTTDRQIDLTCGQDALGACAKGARALALLKDVTALDDWSARSDAVQHYVAAVMATHAVEIDPDLRAMVRHLEHGTHLGDCALSSRQMQRRFADRVGVPAQTLAALFRFRRVFDDIEYAPPWIEAALAEGHFDQPQMTRDFRRFLGCTASDWARHKIGGGAPARRPTSVSYKPERASAE